MMEYLIFETKYFRVEQSTEISIPGYLIVSMKEPVSDFSIMSEEVAADLGLSILKACKIVEEVIKPEKVYVAKFGEQCKQIHFHILPRTKDLLEEYIKASDTKEKPISGPQIFDWARNTCLSNKANEEFKLTIHGTIEQMKKIT